MRPSSENRVSRSVRIRLIVFQSSPDQAGPRGLDPYQDILESQPEIESVDVQFGIVGEPTGRFHARDGADVYVMVIDLDRGYEPAAVVAILEPLLTGQAEVAVATGPGGPLWSPLTWLGLGIGWGCRRLLGTANLFSGLFVVHESSWREALGRSRGGGIDTLLAVILGRQAREVDVPVATHQRFRVGGLNLGDLRLLKQLLDGRHGNLSRLVQFCMVGASGMVVDLSTYALLQWLFSFTVLATRSSSFFGVSWYLVIASALSIATALVWNFSLNLRLTFSYARGGNIIRQFLTYALSNALAIALSFTLRLYLPSRVVFFARHRLAAAVVGIVAATGVSFSMSRWVVFSKGSEHSRSTPRPHETASVEPSSAVL